MVGVVREQAEQTGHAIAVQEFEDEAAKAKKAADEAVAAYRRDGGAASRLRDGSF